mgnify:FL=1
MSTLRINNIEAKSVPANPTLDEKVKITNSSGDVLIHLDGKTAGITTIGINTTASNITFDANSNAQLTGIVTATNFKTGSSNLHSTGLTVGNNLFHSTGINVGTGATIHVPSSNVLTLGTNSNENFRIDSNGKIINTAATDTVATLDLFGGNTNVSGSGEVNAQIRFKSKDASVTGDQVGGTIKSITEIGNGAYVGMAFETFMQGRSPAVKEAFRISYNGQIGLGGQNYGTAGQVLTSQGSGSPVQWATPAEPFGGALDGLIFGGTETTYTSGNTTYKVHSFTSTGFLRVTAATSMDFLIVGGGGGSPNAQGSWGSSGGGGAGGMVEGTGITIPVGKHTVTVGASGAPSDNQTIAGSGGDSSIAYGGTTVVAKGGGGGADYASNGPDGGCGGGGAEPNRAGGASIQSSQNSGISGIQQFGNAGGQGREYHSSPTGSGGGGGAGGAGGVSTGNGGAGGAGRANSITGSSVTYATGGAGGGSGYHHGTPGTNGLGNGAGGASASYPNEGTGKYGGSGIVIVRYVFS